MTLRRISLAFAVLLCTVSMTACETNTDTAKERADDAIDGAITLCGARDAVGSIDGLEEQQDDWIVTCSKGPNAGPHYMDN